MGKVYRTFLEEQKIFSSRKLSEQTAELYRKDRTGPERWPLRIVPYRTKPNQTMPNATEQKHTNRITTLLKQTPLGKGKIKGAAFHWNC
jgi:hypothetical protein